MDFFQLMKTSAEKEDLIFDETKYHQFIKYKDLLKEWNEKINLTAITEDKDIIKKHFIDCIKIFKFKELHNLKNIIDVGTGAGFPGLPIKIVKPEIKVTLLDSLNKRINFLNEVVKELNLKEVETIHARAEDGARQENLRENFDAVVSRAVANMQVLSEFCLPYVKVGGFLVALKGPAIEEEMSNAKNAIGILGGKIEDIIPVEIEDTDLKHNLVIISKIKETPATYPRKAGTITKKPLK